ncbi:MAG: carbamoyltransferase N-terminal domain-containing protein [Acidimicrobiales bacterium]
MPRTTSTDRGSGPVLGISALYHDAAAAVVVDGAVAAAVQQERLSRRKHDPSFPVEAIQACFEEAGVRAGDLAAVAYYDKPLTTFLRIVRSAAAAGPKGIASFPGAMSEWSRRKLWTSYEIERALRSLGHRLPGRPLYAEHHVSHAAAAFFPSPFERAAIITMDGVGEWATSSIGRGRGREVELLREQRFPDSLGLLYSAFTHHCGFRVNSGEYKLMGLAPYGEPAYVERILTDLVELGEDGAMRMDLRYFDHLAGRRMTNARFDQLFDGPARDPEAPIDQRTCDLARSIQEVVERAVLATARTARELTGEANVVLAGGVALNCVANGRLRREGPFEDVWVQPAAGDAGSALGCALWAHHQVLGQARTPQRPDAMGGTYLGPTPDPERIAADLDAAGRPYERIADPDERAARIAAHLADGRVVAVLQGRMEFGPRALGHRSILADARDPDAQRTLNLRVKKREGFRPFAPAVLAEHADEWFETSGPSPYMTFVDPVAADRLVPAERTDGATITEVAAQVRSQIPAVTHVDGSARLQTVDAQQAPELHRILAAFHARTGCPVLVNTSFNVRGEPIVATAEDAYRCFATTDLDVLVLEECLLRREDQPPWDGPMPDLELD